MSCDAGGRGSGMGRLACWLATAMVTVSVVAACMPSSGYPHLMSDEGADGSLLSADVLSIDDDGGSGGAASDEGQLPSGGVPETTPCADGEGGDGDAPGAQEEVDEGEGAASEPPRIALESSTTCSRDDIELWVTASGGTLDHMEVLTAREHGGRTCQSIEELPVVSGEVHELLFSEPGRIHVDVRLVDGEGRCDTASFDGLIDHEAPQVAFEGVQEGMSYRSSPTLWFTCDDENLFTSWDDAPAPSCLMEVMRNGEIVASYPLDSLVRGFEGHSAGLALTIPEEGRYSLYAVCVDAAGNRTEVLSGAFVIDGSVPGLVVSFDNDDVSNGSYYHAPRVATIAVSDADLDPGGCLLDTDGELGTWHEEDSVHMIEVTFAQEGTHHLDVTVRDASGNECAPFHSGDFTIDLTPPEVLIEGLSDHVSYPGDVSGALHVHDEHCDAPTSSVELVGAASGPHEVTMGQTGPTDLDCVIDGFPYVRSSDDIYTLRVRGRDLAGNETLREVVFSVNRFGSTYRVMPGSEAYLAGYGGSGQRCYAESIAIEEVNVDPLVEQRVRVDHDGRVSELQEGIPPRLSATDGTGGPGFFTLSEEEGQPWHGYVYIIDGSTFAQEGAYRIQLHSVDAAGNISDSTLARGGVEVQLVMDLTAPEIRIDDAEAWHTYTGDTHRMTVRAFDNMSPVDLSVTLDGQEAMVPSGEGEAMLEIGADAGKLHVVEAHACDQAGNVSRRLSVPGICVMPDPGSGDTVQDRVWSLPSVLLGLGGLGGDGPRAVYHPHPRQEREAYPGGPLRYRDDDVLHACRASRMHPAAPCRRNTPNPQYPPDEEAIQYGSPTAEEGTSNRALRAMWIRVCGRRGLLCALRSEARPRVAGERLRSR